MAAYIILVCVLFAGVLGAMSDNSPPGKIKGANNKNINDYM